MSDMRAKYVLLGVTIVVTLGILTSSMVPLVESPTTNMAQLLGHVTLVVTDGDGNVKQYIQTDNVVTTEGTDCALIELFGSGTGTGETCPFEGAIANFDTIALGDTKLTVSSATTRANWIAGAGEVARAAATTNEFTALNVIKLEKVFIVTAEGDTNLLDAGQDVEVTALFDALSPNTKDEGNMIAVFDLPAKVTGLQLLDELTITWEITGSQV